MPYAYKCSDEDPLVLVPDPEMVPFVEQAMDYLDEGHPYRHVAEWLSNKTGVSISHQGISKIWKRHRSKNPSPHMKKLRAEARKRKPKTKEEQVEQATKYRLRAAKRNQTLFENKLKRMEAEKEPVEEEPYDGPMPPAKTTPVSDQLDHTAEPPATEIIFRPNPGPQTEFLAASEREVLYGGAAGGGKGLKPDANILTPFGWRKLEDLKVGSKICAADGTTTTIIGYYPRGVQPFYRVSFLDGSVVECDEDHLWLAHTAGRSKKINGTRTFGPEGGKLWTTLQMYEHFMGGGRRLGTPLCAPVQFTVSGTKKGTNFVKREIHPYILGVLLGDGSITSRGNARFTSEDDEIAQRIGEILGISLSRYATKSNAYDYRIPSRFVNGPLEDLELWGKRSENKRIPRIYLLAPEDQRWDLLQGLMDTDGYADEDGDAFFCSVSEGLVDDVRHLARSLGCLVYKTTKSTRYYTHNGERLEGQTAYELRIKCQTPEKLFYLKRKKDRVAGKKYQSMSNWIVSVERIADDESICIAVDHPSRLFITDNFVVTHNTYALIADPMRYFNNPNFNGIILRRTNDELREIIWKSQEIYLKVFEGAKWQEKKSQWVFPSGARLWMTYLERDEDVLRYQGQAFSYIAFDELTQMPTPFAWNYMRSRLRTTDRTLPTFMRATTNPGGPGMQWVKKMFIDPAPPNRAFPATDIDTGEVLRYPESHVNAGKPLFYRKFIPASLYDNPYLTADGAYEANLLSLPEMQRRQLLEGDWNVASGAAFPEFRVSVHTVDPFEIPHDWRRFRSCDFGYSSHSAVHWYAIDPNFSTLYVYRELYLSKHTGRDLARAVLAAEQGELIDYGMLDSSCWHQRGQIGPSIAEEMISAGCKWRPSDRSAGARVAGKNRLHELLKVDERSELPGIIFFNNCRQIIADLPVIPSDPKGSDDIDPRYASDHAYDSLRYGIMSRPRARSPFEEFGKYSQQKPYRPADSAFGY